MKKVSLLILLVIVLSTALMAATPTKMMRLTIINKSGSPVYIQLKGSAATNAFYYLTIPKGDREAPSYKVFTVMSDAYTRTTWQCDGVKSSGVLVVDNNIRLDFLPCGQFLCPKKVSTRIWHDNCHPNVQFSTRVTHYNAGEPTMEKVIYYKALQTGRPSWGNVSNYKGFWNFGCITWYWRMKTYKLPVGCSYRYQY